MVTKTLMLEQIYPIILVPVLCIILFAAVIFIPKLYRYFCYRIFSDEKARSTIFPGTREIEKKSDKFIDDKINFAALKEVIDTAGYAYNPDKDIFFSTMEAWQRKMGYCRLYDEAAAPLSMIIDCEPFYFSYAGKRWLIELWKGQYGMTTGCEVGIYTSKWPDLNIPNIFNGTFYTCANDSETLYMQCYLKKNGETILSRKNRHWWLTGFKLGEFSEPSELILDVYISFKSRRMRRAFVEAVQRAGYTTEEYEVRGKVVAIRFDKPHTRQPFSRTIARERIMQKRNKMYCDLYQGITSDYSNMAEKINAVKGQSPDLYKEVFNIGKTKPLYNTYKTITYYMNPKNSVL
jgi:hypothetical protein